MSYVNRYKDEVVGHLNARLPSGYTLRMASGGRSKTGTHTIGLYGPKGFEDHSRVPYRIQKVQRPAVEVAGELDAVIQKLFGGSLVSAPEKAADEDAVTFNLAGMSGTVTKVHNKDLFNIVIVETNVTPSRLYEFLKGVD